MTVLNLRLAHLAALFCLLPIFGANGQRANFKVFTTMDGLPQNSVTSLMEDEQGFIWIGTNDGLARFDGYDFTIWRRDEAASSTLPNNSITDLAQDKSGRIWIATGYGGLTMYNPKKDAWKTWPMDSAGVRGPVFEGLENFEFTDDTTFWAANYWFLQKVTLIKDSLYFSHYPMNNEGLSKALTDIRDISYDGNDRLWLASPRGLVAFNIKNEKFEYGPGQLQHGLDSSLYSLEFDINGDLWVAPVNRPLKLIKKEKLKPGAFGTVNPYVPSAFNLGDDRKIKKTKDGKMLIAGQGGLKLVNMVAGKADFKSYSSDQALKNSLPDPLVWDALQDRAGNLWVGTERGLACNFSAAPVFNALTPQSLGLKFSEQVFRIYAAKNGNVWFGAMDGLFRYNPLLATMDKLILPGPKAEGPGSIGGIDEDRDGNIWCVCWPWLYKIDPNTLAVEKIPVKYFRDIPYQAVVNLVIDTQGWIWLGQAAAVAAYNPQTDQWKGTTLDYMTYITGIDELDQNTMVVSSSGFLFKVNKQNPGFELMEKKQEGQLSEKPYLENAKDVMVYEDKIYCAAKNGLFIHDLTTAEWKTVTTANGMPGNFVRALSHDDYGNIWMSGNQGICRYNPATGEINVYNPTENIGCVEFNSRAVARGTDGQVYFGCDAGVLSFDPAAFKKNKYHPPVYFTGLKIFNQEVTVNPDLASERRFSIPNSINYLSNLHLHHSHSVITIEYAALNYLEPYKAQYAHRLIGFDDGWVHDGNNRSATYTNLDPGQYTLEVKASNNEGVWGKQVASMAISIAPPWYFTPLAFTVYVILIGGMAYSLVVWRVNYVRREERVKNRINTARLEERENFRKKSAADFHDEAGNKITKINLFTELARSEVNGNVELRNYLKGIEQNAKALSAGMRDFIWVMDPAKDSVFDTVLRLQAFGDSMFAACEISFETIGLEKDMSTRQLPMAARRAIVQIYKEAMNNCVKYAGASRATLEVGLENNRLHLVFTDDGDGFDPAAIGQNHYGLKIMGDRAEGIRAHLKVNSKKGVGTQVVLIYKIPQMSDAGSLN